MIMIGVDCYSRVEVDNLMYVSVERLPAIEICQPGGLVYNR